MLMTKRVKTVLNHDVWCVIYDLQITFRMYVNINLF